MTKSRPTNTRRGEAPRPTNDSGRAGCPQPASAGVYDSGSTRRQWFWVALPCALFLAQQLPLFQHRWVEDESWQSIPAYTLLTEGRLRNPTFAETDSEFEACVKPPGHTWLLWPMFKCFGVGVWQARLPSLLAGLGVVVLTFLLARELAGLNAGIIGALLVATDNTLFLAGRTARPEVFLAFSALLAAWLALRAKAAGSGLAVGAAMMFHPTGAATALGTAALVATKSRNRFWVFAATVAVVALLFLAWSHSSPIHSAAFASTYGRVENVPLAEKVRSEASRYADFLGFGNLRLNFPVAVPVRAHIVAAIVAGFAVLAWKNRRTFAVLAMLSIPYLLWWMYLINKTARYFAVVAPFFALALAAAVCALAAERKWRMPAIVGCAIIGLSQLAGNLLLLVKSRPADYPAVQRELRQFIPPGSSVYGAITFWTALHDRTYYSYERMPFDYAIAKRRPEYLILNDRVMVKGMGWGLDDWAKLRAEANAFAREHGELAGRVSHPFYGDLEIWRVKYPL